MASNDVPRNGGTGPGQIYVWETTLTADASGDDSVTSPHQYNGLVWMVQIIPTGTPNANSNIKGYEASTGMATPPYFVNSTGNSETIIYGPVIEQDSPTGAAVTTAFEHVAVAGKLTLVLDAATEDDVFTVRTYILG